MNKDKLANSEYDKKLEKLRKEHEKVNESVSSGKKDKLKSNGYCILFDIIDSTKRKRIYDFWINHVEMTEAFTKELMRKIHNEIINNVVSEKHSKEIKTFHKSLGDGFLIFINSPFDYHKDTKNIDDEGHKKYTEKTSKLILDIIIKEYLAFKSENKRKNNSKDLEDLEMKIVITYLTNIYCKGLKEEKGSVESDRNIEEVLGRGIDFVFRIEKFAGTSHIMVNEMFYKTIKPILNSDNGYFCQEVERYLKGWPKDPQTFYMLSNKAFLVDIEHNDKMISSPNDKDVNIELIKLLTDYYNSSRKKRTNNEEEDISKFNKILNSENKKEESSDE